MGEHLDNHICAEMILTKGEPGEVRQVSDFHSNTQGVADRNSGSE